MHYLKEVLQYKRDDKQSVQMQLVNAFILNIRNGHLRKGLKLPGSRKLAELLNVNRSTMVAVYDELTAQGWIDVVPKTGTFIKVDLQELEPIDTGNQGIRSYPFKSAFKIDINPLVSMPKSVKPQPFYITVDAGFPDVRIAPVKELVRNMRRLYTSGIYRNYLKYGKSSGLPKFRETLAGFLHESRGLPISSKNIMITYGAQMGFNLIARLLIGQNKAKAIMTDPGYFGIRLVLQQMGAEIYTVPIDSDGMDVDAVEQICKKHEIKLVYTIPHHHNPTTITLSPERRIRLLELASKYGFAIIEDDFDYDFHYDSNPMLPMASMDRDGNVIYLGSFTKLLAPGIRLGFIVAPENFINIVTEQRKLWDFQGDNIMEASMVEFFRDGTMSRHIRKSVKLYEERRNHFCESLTQELGNRISFNRPKGGMAIWAKFSGGDSSKIIKTAQEKGLILPNTAPYFHGTNPNKNIRMGFASLNLKEQERVVNILSQCV